MNSYLGIRQYMFYRLMIKTIICTLPQQSHTHEPCGRHLNRFKWLNFNLNNAWRPKIYPFTFRSSSNHYKVYTTSHYDRNLSINFTINKNFTISLMYFRLSDKLISYFCSIKFSYKLIILVTIYLFLSFRVTLLVFRKFSSLYRK